MNGPKCVRARAHARMHVQGRGAVGLVGLCGDVGDKTRCLQSQAVRMI